MGIHAVIYSKKDCRKCEMTNKQLSEHMRVKHEQLFDGNDDWSDRKINKFKDQGYMSMPVVRIYDDDSGNRLDDWSDFQYDKIKKWSTIADSYTKEIGVEE